MNECKGMFGWMFGHKFGAVYDRIPPVAPDFEYVYFPADQALVVEKLTQRVFKGLYCPRCGAMTLPEDAP